MKKNGKTNNFRDLHKISNKLRHFDKITWTNSLSKEKKFRIEDLLLYIQSSNSEISNKIPFDSEIYNNFKIVGTCSFMHDHLEGIYLISDPDYKSVYVTIGRCHPIFWYKYVTRKDFFDNFDIIYDTYMKSDLNFNFEKSIRVCIGNSDILSIDIHDIENNLLMQKYTDKLIYGSLWQDHPFRNEYNSKVVNAINSIIFTGQAMRQENLTYSVSVRTQYSKSLITIYDFDETFILEIKYNPIDTKQLNNINEIIDRNYHTDIPIDVIMSLVIFPFLSHMDIIKMRPLIPYHLYLLDIIVTHNGNLMVELEPELKSILKNKLNDQFESIVYESIESLLEIIDNYKIFLTIIASDDIKEIIDNLNDDDDLDNLVDTLQHKYNCDNDDHMHEQLIEYILHKFECNEDKI